MTTNRGGPARTVIGLAAFIPLAVLALVLPNTLQVGEPEQLPSAAHTPAATAARTQGAVTRQPSSTTHTGPLTTRCKSVLYIGDSTSEGVISTTYLPDANDHIDARLRAAGVSTFTPEIAGARAIIEHYKGEPNGEDVVNEYVAQGYRGCWIIALGNNDAANISVGGAPSEGGRIDLLMKKIGDQPVLWVNTRTLVVSGPNSQANMAKWNSALIQACSRYPNLRLNDWAGEVQPEWFTQTDKIHYTTPGYRECSRRIARATAIAYPATGNSPEDCTVGSR